MSLRSIFLLLPLALLFTGCASTATTPTTLNDADNSNGNISNVPWNKPANWETDGQLGGLSGH